jgi:hypothetical protein
MHIVTDIIQLLNVRLLRLLLLGLIYLTKIYYSGYSMNA